MLQVTWTLNQTKKPKKGGVNVIVISRDYGEDINLRRTFDDQSLTGDLSQ